MAINKFHKVYPNRNAELRAVSKLLDEIEMRPTLDLPETALPGAPLQNRTGVKK